MTDKRLIVDENYNLVDTVTGEWLDDTQVFDLANKLHEENKQCKEYNAKLYSNSMKSEKQLLKQIKELEKENNELKYKNELLSDELEQCKAVINKKWSEYLKKKME